MFSNLVKRFAFVLCICVLAGFLSGTPVSAADPLIFDVNTTIDQRDLATNGVCSIGAPVGGACTLRAAISEAIGNLPYSDITINVPAGTYELTIPPDETNDIHTGDLDFPDSDSVFTVSIIGTDKLPAVIDANQLDRVLRIGAGVHLSIKNAVIRGGIIMPTDANLFGAGISNVGNLLIEKVTVEANRGDCDMSTCSAPFAGAGIAHLGHGYLSIVDSTIRNNIANNGSAIYNDSAQISIRNSTIANNHAVAGSSIINHGSIDFLNSTISGNSAGEGVITGIYNSGTIKIMSSTLSNPGPFSSIQNMPTGSVTVLDSILAAYPEDTSFNCDPTSSGTWTSTGYNIFSDDTCPWNGLAGDMQNTNPLLGPLGDWGGPTQTLPLSSKSPALDHRPTACMLALAPLKNDQRYYPRNDTMCDTGAFEGSLNISQAFLPAINR